jgi:hypothetical protein
MENIRRSDTLNKCSKYSEFKCVNLLNQKLEIVGNLVHSQITSLYFCAVQIMKYLVNRVPDHDRLKQVYYLFNYLYVFIFFYKKYAKR